MVDDPDMPEYFYKYGFNLDYLRDVLLENKIYFTSPLQINDPFECRPKVILGDERLALKEMKDAIKTEKPELNCQQVNDLARQRLKDLQDKDDLTDEWIPIMGRMGVYSLSEIYDSLLMWAYYSNGHQGYCLGFTNQLAGSSSETQPTRVKYRDERLVIKVFGGDQKRYRQDLLITKSTVWIHEQEWRCSSHEKGFINFPPETLVRIILGCMMDPDVKQKIWEMRSKRSAPLELWEAKMHRNRYALEFVKLD